MTGPFQPRRLLIFAGALTALAGCGQGVPKHLQPLSYSTIKALEKQGLSKEDPILIRIYKKESELEVWKRSAADGKFTKFKTYGICAWGGGVGPKIREGDKQSPEGFYAVTPALMNPNSSYHLSFNIGYPNAFDQAHGRTGSAIMVHGACSSAGCFAMTDERVAEIYALAREAFDAGQRSIQVQSFPFRMTPDNMAVHAASPHVPFWRNLKEGSDHFEVTREAPKVAVCDRRYVFNPSLDEQFDPTGPCPAYEVAEPLRTAVAQKDAQDRAAEQVVLARLGIGGGTSTPMTPAAAPVMVAQPAGAPATLAMSRLPQDEAARRVAATAPGYVSTAADIPALLAAEAALSPGTLAPKPVPLPTARPAAAAQGESVFKRRWIEAAMGVLRLR
jgi:murein L,D-transpeptidase YafK